MDDPARLSKQGAHLRDGTHHLAPGDVICIRSRPNAPPHCRTAALIYRKHHYNTYALPLNTQLTHEEAQEPPLTASYLQ